MPAKIDITGHRFGKWTVLSYAGSKNSICRWLCRCDCGREFVVQSHALRNGRSLQCKPCTRTKHNGARTRLYSIWKEMRKRCRDPNSISYKYYGGKGVRVCPEWDAFEPFRDWAHENGYRDDLTIDRIDSDHDYEPSNCRWATPAEQTRNRKVTPRFEYQGKRWSVGELAEICGIRKDTLRSRLNAGWPVEKALSTPVKSRPPQE